MRLPRFAIAAAASLLLLGVSACSSSDSSDSASKASTTTATSGDSSGNSSEKGSGGSVTAVEVCPMVDPAAVTALGLSGPGESSDRVGPPGVAIGVCTFGSIIDETGALVVQVESKSKDAPVDPLMAVLKGASQTAPTAASKPSGAKVYDLAVIPGGGGVGNSVAWEGDGRVVVAARTGNNVDVAQLENIVAGVVDQL
jgi:hypothetical protein